jgi:hypothetical protein
MTYSANILSIVTYSIKTLRIATLNITMFKRAKKHKQYSTQQYSESIIFGECRYVERCIFSALLSAVVLSVRFLIVMLSVVLLSVIMLSVVMLSVVMLNVVMLSVVILSVVMLSVIMLSVFTLSVVMLSVIMLSVFILSVVMLSVVDPHQQLSKPFLFQLSDIFLQFGQTCIVYSGKLHSPLQTSRAVGLAWRKCGAHSLKFCKLVTSSLRKKGRNACRDIAKQLRKNVFKKKLAKVNKNFLLKSKENNVLKYLFRYFSAANNIFKF